MILHYLEDGRFNGFYQLESDNLKFPNVKITKDLWHRLVDFGNFKLNIEKLNENLTDNLVLGIKDFETYFIKIESQEEKGTHPLVSMMNNLEKENASLLQESLQKDIQIKELNMNLAKATLKSINKDIEINNLNTNMAQTTLNLVNKDIQIKSIEKDIANLILKSLGGK
ncbi:hypothetical protein UT300013_33380 [Paraclostridium sordellii]